jgi:tRNA-specific 2-thiouridylase
LGKSKKVFVALSGGVDSSTTAALLLKAGFDCAGVFFITSDNSLQAQTEAENVAKKLGIKFFVLDLRSDFEQMLTYFCSEYEKGRTPNPCVLCNKLFKFRKLWDFANSKGADLLATGHYARIIKNNGQVGLYEAAYTAKDQSYALAMIDSKILPYIILPMGSYSKKQTREMAAKFGLGTEQKAESQEICFIPDYDYIAFLEQRYPEIVRKGSIINSSGNILGEHNGIHRFTIGQRRGLHVAMGKPYYVVKIDAMNNTVTLGPKEELMYRQLLATDVNWLIDELPIQPGTSTFRAIVKIRYRDIGTSALVSAKDNSVTVVFDEPKPAITPGQLAAFYLQEGDNNRIIGGGWIDKVYN